MSLFYTDVKKKKEDLQDIFISQVSIYGEKIDFFFQTVSVTTISDPYERGKKQRDLNLVRLQPEKI